MCGICGGVDLGRKLQDPHPVLQRMCQVLIHRGPDDEGYFFDGEAMLGMRRLSIIDLVTGRQPISNENGTLHLVFNGEIYNYRDIRQGLEQKGHRFQTSSDSEVIIHAYEEYGRDCLNHFNGMFAFAIWDSVNRALFLARDRVGIKPLYYWSRPGEIVFGSELTALIAHPHVPRQIDPAALDAFLTFEYIPHPQTIFDDVKKLPPGHWLLFQDGRVRVEPYWNVRYNPITADEASCIEQLTGLLEDAVRLQLVSDVPLGAFLSGGIDSSTVVAGMSAARPDSIRTYSIGFGEESYNELPSARAVAERFGTQHHETILRPEIGGLVEKLVGHLDEPLGDFSIFPTYLVSEVAGRDVKVVLSGDGGDELFGGYETYQAEQIDRHYRKLPDFLRRQVLPGMMTRIPPRPEKKGIVNKAKRFVEGGALPQGWGHTRWMMFLNDQEKKSLYSPALQAELAGRQPATGFVERHYQDAAAWDPLAQQQYVDLKSYLVDNILTKVDRMSMAASIEARVPLLDYRIVEFALNLPPHFKRLRGESKVILRRAMSGRLPEVVLNKPKQGFSIPLKHWLRGPLRPLMTDLLASDTIRRRGYFQAAAIEQWIGEHLAGRANHSHRLWGLMVFELWQRRQLEG